MPIYYHKTSIRIMVIYDMLTNRGAWILAIIMWGCFLMPHVAFSQTSTGCGVTQSYPADGCSSCSISHAGDGNDYSISGNNATVCLTGGSIHLLTISGANNIIRICSNTTINSIGTNLGTGNVIVITSGNTLNFTADNATSTGTPLMIVNYGTLNYSGGVSNIYALTILNIGSFASINITGDLYLNGGTTNINMLFGGTLNISGKLSFNSQTNFICINNNAIVTTRDIEINQPDNLHVDPSSNSCLSFTGTATINKTLTPDVLKVCQGATATVINNNGTTAWGSNVAVTANCISCATLLPVKLQSFTVSANNSNAALLEWVSIAEANTDRFDVQRSKDGAFFETIGSRNAAGSSSATVAYSYTDRKPLTNMNYYRLKMIDKDGQYDYSAIKSIKISGNDNTFRLVSNTGNNLLLQLPPVNSKAFARLVDLQGKIIWQQQINAGQSELTIPAAGIPEGNYIVQYNDSQQKQSLQVFIRR